jgi:hypothetical protein
MLSVRHYVGNARGGIDICQSRGDILILWENGPDNANVILPRPARMLTSHRTPLNVYTVQLSLCCNGVVAVKFVGFADEFRDNSAVACPRPRLLGGALSGFVIMFKSDDYIALFVPFFDVPVGLSDFFQRIASINDRF